MVKWHHQLNGDEFEQTPGSQASSATPGDGEGQGSLDFFAVHEVAKSHSDTPKLLNNQREPLEIAKNTFLQHNLPFQDPCS